jgi:hypothetical protein
MPVTRKKGEKPPPPDTSPLSSRTDRGAWTQNEDGSWTWVIGGTPDPELVRLWGPRQIQDPRQDPTGVRNKGAWFKHRNGWEWRWGAEPDEYNLSHWSREQLTDPDHFPSQSKLDHASTDDQHLEPPDVTPPTIDDVWNGTPPNITGARPEQGGDGDRTSLNEPPEHPMFTVSPGGIRDAEITILTEVDATIEAYNPLRATVMSSYADISYRNIEEGDNYWWLRSSQDNLLLGIGDAIRLVGQYVSMLNISAQTYARADMDSVMTVATTATPQGNANTEP